MHLASSFVGLNRLAPLLILLVLGMAQHAAAQGTTGTLPDPITTPELMRYADRLGLSGEQRRAAERLHDEYREQFRALREGEIAQFLTEMRGMQGMMPERRSFEQFMKNWDRLFNRIAQLDDQLFFRMQELLTDQQMAMLPRVRLERERARYSGSMAMMMSGSGIIDLTSIIDQIDIMPAERQAIDPLLASYEQRLTAGARDLYRAGNRMFIDMFNAFENAGITEENMQDPQEMGRMMEVMEQVMRDIYGGILDHARNLREINSSAVRNVRSLVSEPTGRALRNRFYSQAYPTAEFALRLPVEAKIAAAISHERVSEGLRESLVALESETRLRLDRILDQAVDLHEVMQNSIMPFGGGDGFDWQEHQRRTSELQAAAHEINREVQGRLTAMLATELDEAAQQQIASAEHQPESEPRRRFRHVMADAAQDQDQQHDAARSSFDPYLPDAISDRDLTIYRRMLRLDESRVSLFEELHASYLERFEAIKEGKLKPIADARAKMWSPPTEGGDEDVIERISRLRRDALAAIIALDASFFDDVALVVLGDDEQHLLDRVRLHRTRDMYNVRSPLSTGMFGGSALGRVDLSRLIRLQSLPDAELARIDPILADYEKKAADALKAQYEATLAFQEIQDRWSIGFARTQREGGRTMEHAMQYHEAMREPQRTLSETSKRLAKLNEETIDQLLAALGEEHARTLLAAFRRQAYPSVYNDPAAAEDHILSAMRLTDLSERQRADLAELLADYRPTYASLSEQMVELARKSGTDVAYADFEPEDWQRQMDLMEKFATLRFDRNELNSRAIGRLKAILNDGQLAHLGPLPEPMDEPSAMWGF